jgi:hypothetical protein
VSNAAIVAAMRAALDVWSGTQGAISGMLTLTNQLTADDAAPNLDAIYQYVRQRLSNEGAFNVGRDSVAAGSDAVALGEVSALADNAFAHGGPTAIAQAPQSEAGGAVSSTRGIRGLNVRANNVWDGDKVGNGTGTPGTAQNEEACMQCVTTDATPGILTTDGNPAGWYNVINLSSPKYPSAAPGDRRIIVAHLIVMALEPATGLCRSWSVLLQARSLAYHQAEIFSPLVTPIPGPPGVEAWSLQWGVDQQLEAPLFKVQGEAGKTIQWYGIYLGGTNAVSAA